MCWTSFAPLLTAAAVGMLVICDANAMPCRKYVIARGHDITHIARHGVHNYVKYLPKLQETGVDGIVLALPDVPVCGRRLEIADFEGWRTDISTVARSLPQSMLLVGLTMEKRFSWDDEAGWDRVTHNLGVLARFAKETGLKGLFLDEEDYKETKQFFRLPADGEYAIAALKARRRGRQVFTEVFSEFPDIRVSCSWLFSTVQKWHAWAVPERGDDLCALKQSYGELWLDFMNGCIDVLTPGAKLCEGGEQRGFHGLAENGDFAVAAWRASRGSLELVAPENRGRFLAHLSISFGQYCDMYTNPKMKDYYIGPYAGSRLNHFRLNLANALNVADDFVWLYGEKGTFVDWERDLSKSPGVDTEGVYYHKTWDEQLPGFSRMIKIAKGDYSPLEAEILDGRLALDTSAVSTWTRDKEPEADRFVRTNGILRLNGEGCFVQRASVRPGDDVYVKCEVRGDRPRIGIAFYANGISDVERFGRAMTVAPEEGWKRGEWTELIRHVFVPEGVDTVQVTLGGVASHEDPNEFRNLRIYHTK